MISLTLLTALAVKLMGAFFVSAGFTSGVVVVAIGISLKGLAWLSRHHYNKASPGLSLQNLAAFGFYLVTG